LWRARATEHGLDRKAVLGLLGRSPAAAPELVAVDVEQLTEQASTFGRAELLQALAAAQPDGARLADIERVADVTLGDPDVVRLAEFRAQAGVVEQRFTTRDMLATESGLIEGALARRKTRVAVTSVRTVERVLDEHGSLNPEQRQLVRDVCRRGDGVAHVRAAAGTGKTFALDAARRAWERDGIAVLGCALSARAARELQDQSAIAAFTIAAVRRALDDGRQLPRRCVRSRDGRHPLAGLPRRSRSARSRQARARRR
jgi:ATP-dependent exoDNAse (exonuclease V) alpha subunit